MSDNPGRVIRSVGSGADGRGEGMAEFYHSVTLISSRCKGCINCIKRCPTEAIRVRNGKAYILSERCIDCGECIRVCPHHAKQAAYDSIGRLKEFRYTVALPAPALFGQFADPEPVGRVLGALRGLGFDDVFEVSAAAEMISAYTHRLMAAGVLPKPVISSACPAVTRLIRVRFPNLCRNVLPLLAPVELAARLARQRAVKATGLSESEIGVFFISPCPAKVTYARMPLGIPRSALDGVLAISDIYPRIAEAVKHHRVTDLPSASGSDGIGWAGSGGEAAALHNDKYLAADGIENVIKVLEEVEDEKLGELEFIELNACSGGCVGGVLTVENPYVARARLQRLRKGMPPVRSQPSPGANPDAVPDSVRWTVPLEYVPVMKLDDDVAAAMRKMQRIDTLLDELPGLDCGSCGAPSCRAFAEDVVRGMAVEGDCIFRMRERVQKLIGELSAIESYTPPPFRTAEGEGDASDAPPDGKDGDSQ